MQSVSSDLNVVYRWREWIAKDNPDYEYIVSTMDEREKDLYGSNFSDCFRFNKEELEKAFGQIKLDADRIITINIADPIKITAPTISMNDEVVNINARVEI
jgi:hypothetical protein